MKLLKQSFFTIFLITTSLANAIDEQEYKPASIWTTYAQTGSLPKKEIIPSFLKDCQKARDAGENDKIPAHDKTIARIAVYNVHFWTSPERKPAYAGIMNTIKNIQADVIALQEVLLFDPEKINNDFAHLGYRYRTFMPMNRWKGHLFGNMIVSKYPFDTKPYKKTYDADQYSKREKRNFIHTIITLPDTNKISLCGTHLDVWDETEQKRLAEVKELIAHACADTYPNKVLLADWNAVRKQDYQYNVAQKQVWKLLTKNFQERTGLTQVPTQTLDYIESAGFTDSFAKKGIPSPRYTVWSGTRVDLIYLAQTWKLPIRGCYVYYGTNPEEESDHMPIIMDVLLQPKAKL
ncbi:MAG TPA: endonuclease/exonuclease/phosphatase family protein [Candidatus Babeliales bacterium]|nr:endonuclease/exonuclease/phosphatase family protein [Candidatus Babeliales bacterium]